MLPGCGVALLPARPVDLRAQGEGVVEYPGKVACPSGRRCSTRNAVWCHSHPGFKSQRYRHCRPAPLGPGGFVMPSWRAVWLCGPTGVPGAGGLGCGAGLLCVPVGGGPPASRPRCELRSARRLEARPGPAATHGHRSLAHRSLRGALHTGGAGSLMCALRVDSLSGQALPPPTGTAARPTSPSGALHTSGVWSLIVARRVVSKPGQALPPPINFARNSPAACSSFEYISLELQRFWGVSKNDRRKLCATFGQCGLCCRLRVLGSDSPAIHALVIPEAVGVLHYTKPAGGVSPACRTLV